MFLSCGDALFDLFSGKGSGTANTSPSHVTLSGDAGGSPMNVAVGLSRLGHHSRFFTKVSNDLFGQRLKMFLDTNNVDTSLAVPTTLNTTLAIVETQEDGSADYAFYTDNTADVMIESGDVPSSLDADIRLLHFGSYSTAVEPVASSLMGFAERETANRIISYDPNLRPSIEPDVDRWREVFKAFAATANLIKASDEDIASLLGKIAKISLSMIVFRMALSWFLLLAGLMAQVASKLTAQWLMWMVHRFRLLIPLVLVIPFRQRYCIGWQPMAICLTALPCRVMSISLRPWSWL